MLKQLVPHLNVDTIFDIDLKALKEQGVKGIITDLDNTLVGAKRPDPTPQIVDWIQLVKSHGFQVVIVSNNNRLRVSQFAAPLSVPYIYQARKPTNYAFRRALELMGLKADETVVVGDQMLTDVFGGNRMGLYTILVTPIALEEESFYTRFNRFLEKKFMARLKKKGLIPWEDRK
jgi:HAD superfamily phosphatase (TIGR01668 family)